MRAWLYARLSNDEDEELNSLHNQEAICREFALENGFEIVGKSFDDNVSGMKFSRKGLYKVTESVEKGLIDAVIVKDMSRLGRHKTQTALYIDFLRENGVKVLSIIECLDTFNDEDDLVIGVRGMMNDFYAKDIGKKVKSGYRQKQKEGLVIIPPFGYWKDKNTDEICIDEEAEKTIKTIFSLCLTGYSLKETARYLNEMHFKTPAEIQKKRYNRDNNHLAGRYIWTYSTVKKVLTNECYTGVLYNHVTEMKNGKGREVPKNEQIRHEAVYPVIIKREVWQEVQSILNAKVKKSYGNKAKHRYAGLLRCAECQSPFSAKIRKYKGKERVEYVCKTYHKNSSSYCTPHRLHEEKIDEAVREYLENLKADHIKEQKLIAKKQKMWAFKKPKLDAHILILEERIERLEGEVDDILMEKVRGEC